MILGEYSDDSTLARCAAPNTSLELTGLSWRFARFVGVAIEIGKRRPAAWAALQLRSAIGRPQEESCATYLSHQDVNDVIIEI
jgi:hypothetical protein